MLRTPREIKRAIRRARDFYDPVTGSIVVLAELPGKGTHSQEPFRRGFLDTLDERHEIIRRLWKLQERERRALIMWYLETRTKQDIAERLGISRMHVYRVCGRAIDKIIKMGPPPADEDAPGPTEEPGPTEDATTAPDA